MGAYISKIWPAAAGDVDDLKKNVQQISMNDATSPHSDRTWTDETCGDLLENIKIAAKTMDIEGVVEKQPKKGELATKSKRKIIDDDKAKTTENVDAKKKKPSVAQSDDESESDDERTEIPLFERSLNVQGRRQRKIVQRLDASVPKKQPLKRSKTSKPAKEHNESIEIIECIAAKPSITKKGATSKAEPIQTKNSARRGRPLKTRSQLQNK